MAVLLYTALFALALWYLRSKGPRAHAAGSPGPAGRAPLSAARRGGAPDRAFLLSGAGLTGAAREQLGRRLGAQRCDCGCELTLHDCLARDQSCSRSPEIAATLARELR